MIWQDWVFGIGGFLFSLALIPTIRAKEKPSIASSVMTGSILTAYLMCYATLGLWIGFASGVLTASAWFVLAIQKWQRA
jgi:hypothetical protein